MITDKNSGRGFSDYLTDIQHPKLVITYDLPKVDKKTLDNIKSEYNIRKSQNVLKILGFDLTTSGKRGCEYVSAKPGMLKTMEVDLSWKHYSREEIENGATSYIDRYGIERITKIINPFYIGKKTNCIQVHELSRFLTRKAKSSKYGICDDYILQNIYRYDNKTIGMSASPRAKCVVFDIDNHDYDSEENGKSNDLTLTLLYEKMNYEKEAFIERSVKNGYHVGWLTTGTVSDYELLEFCNEFKQETGFEIEARITTKPFRIPCHFSYNMGETERVGYDIKFVPFDKINQLNLYQDRVLEADRNNERVDISIFRKEKPAADVNENKIINLEEERVKRKKKSSIYRRKKYRGKRNQYTNSLKLAAGMRYKNMMKRAMIARRDGQSFDEYFRELNENATTSKDWAKWDYDKKIKEARSAYDNAVNYQFYFNDQEEADCESFVSSEDHIPARILKLLENPLIINHFCRHTDKAYSKNKDRKHHEMGIVLKEVIGKYIYETINRRETVAPEDLEPGITCSNKFLINLAAGVQYPDSFIETMKEHFSMKCDVRGLVYDVLCNTDLFLQYKHTPKGYRHAAFAGDFSFCRQWYIIRTSAHDMDYKEVIDTVNLILSDILSLYENVIYIKKRKQNSLCMGEVLVYEETGIVPLSCADSS